jgi:hypothetical protein
VSEAGELVDKLEQRQSGGLSLGERGKRET